MALQRERILILAKTYPSPSAKYSETSCVAGINQEGRMRRLYPVPFRMLEEGEKFKKWQWIEAIVEKAKTDHRPESHKVDIGTLAIKEQIKTSRGWAERRHWMDKIPTFNSYDALEKARENEGVSIALLRPKQVVDLEIKAARHQNWTDEEREKLIRDQMQDKLFTEDQARQDVKLLRKVPFDFYYNYLCDTPDGETSYKHKIDDWEAGALYWKCCKRYGNAWEQYFRAKLEDQIINKDLMFLMGNIHRFQHQWLIISLFYPPRPTLVDDPQLPLL